MDEKKDPKNLEQRSEKETRKIMKHESKRKTGEKVKKNLNSNGCVNSKVCTWVCVCVIYWDARVRKCPKMKVRVIVCINIMYICVLDSVCVCVHSCGCNGVCACES